jgi:hypothetical protein
VCAGALRRALIGLRVDARIPVPTRVSTAAAFREPNGDRCVLSVSRPATVWGSKTRSVA